MFVRHTEVITLKDLNILIITAPFGNGHKMAAKSLHDAFLEEGCNVMICDLFTESHPRLTSNLSKTHLKLFNMGHAYSYLYYGIDKISRTKLINIYKRFGYNQIKQISKEFEPNIIINTFPVLSSSEYSKKFNVDIPVINVVTDYCCHNLWLNESVDRIYIATDDLKEKLKKLKVPISKLEVTGIPIRHEFEKAFDRKQVFEKYDLCLDKNVILLSPGVQGSFRQLRDVCKDLDQYDHFQTILLCGNNLKLKAIMDEMNFKNLRTFGYIEEVHELYKIASFMITKPGGITLSEAVATNLPLILYRPVAGQEKENAHYFVSKGAAVIADNKTELIYNVLDFLSNDTKLDTMKKNMKRFYKASPSKKIVNDLISRYAIS
jgi:processive 1,2-diacylglycerol beta-glucosyltransferase